jgi:hypothetical protein
MVGAIFKRGLRRDESADKFNRDQPELRQKVFRYLNSNRHGGPPAYPSLANLSRHYKCRGRANPDSSLNRKLKGEATSSEPAASSMLSIDYL